MLKMVAEKIGRPEPWATYSGAIGLEQGGVIVAGMVLTGYVPGVLVEASWAVADKKSLTREFLHAIFDYPFRVLNLPVMVGKVSAENRKSINFCERLGCELAGRVHKGYDGKVDLLIYQMRRDRCQWTGGRK